MRVEGRRFGTNVSLADVLGPGSERLNGGETYEKRVVIGDGDVEVVGQVTRVPVGSRTIPDAEVDDAGGLEGSGDNGDVRQADGAPGVIKRKHLRAGRQVILDRTTS